MCLSDDPFRYFVAEFTKNPITSNAIIQVIFAQTEEKKFPRTRESFALTLCRSLRQAFYHIAINRELMCISMLWKRKFFFWFVFFFVNGKKSSIKDKTENHQAKSSSLFTKHCKAREKIANKQIRIDLFMHREMTKCCVNGQRYSIYSLHTCILHIPYSISNG